MNSINHTFEDVLGKNGKSFINLKPNKNLTINDQKPPVIWSDYVNESYVSLKWNGGSFTNRNNYEISDLPVEVNYCFNEILKCIDNFYRYLD